MLLPGCKKRINNPFELYQNSHLLPCSLQGFGPLWYDISQELEMDDKITIIEGPPPVFENIDDGWALGLNESPVLYDTALTRLRTFNGPALVERCHRAWSKNLEICLHYRDELGLEAKAPILAARAVDGSNGQVLYLWVRRDLDESETDTEVDDDQDYSSN